MSTVEDRLAEIEQAWLDGDLTYAEACEAASALDVTP